MSGSGPYPRDPHNVVWPGMKPGARRMIDYILRHGPLEAEHDVVTEKGYTKLPHVDIHAHAKAGDFNPTLFQRYWKTGVLYARKDGTRFLYIDLSDESKEKLAQAEKKLTGQNHARSKAARLPRAPRPASDDAVVEKVGKLVKENAQLRARVADLEEKLADITAILDEATAPD